eukprot:CAMPEP_0119466886 /NCGR_PEP_ID=MMETSP1344-20130328/1334_1 /TAXON_ID=236787 /ORGANISM="Florenciella parvula, Strain CCMP2471" /LENGTH=58 /DNA_ID=CAMNT_0007499225 /DNA_START=824 /DNA_END=1000 /DNA_ORIENTATION=-
MSAPIQLEEPQCAQGSRPCTQAGSSTPANKRHPPTAPPPSMVRVMLVQQHQRELRYPH